MTPAERELRKKVQRQLQAAGMSRTEARAAMYGETWKVASAPGRGVNRQKPKPRDDGSEAGTAPAEPEGQA